MGGERVEAAPPESSAHPRYPSQAGLFLTVRELPHSLRCPQHVPAQALGP